MTTVWRPRVRIDVPDVGDAEKTDTSREESTKKGTKRKSAPKHHGPCEHGVKPRSNCKVCRACPHGRKRSECKECGGASICEHGRRRDRCKECGGKGICEHGRHRHRCNECDFVAATMRSQCKVLTGQQSGGAVIGAKRARMQNGWTVTKITSWISTATEDTERRERSFSHVDARLGLGPG